MSATSAQAAPFSVAAFGRALSFLARAGRPGDARLTTTQMSALLSLHGREPNPVTFGAVMEDLSLHRANVSRTIDDLVRLDLAARTENPSDRRVCRAELTEQGRRLMKGVGAILEGRTPE